MAEGKDAGGFHYDSSVGGNGPLTSGRRRLIRVGGPTPRVRDNARPRDPGGGAVSTVSPQRTITDDAFQTVERSGGGPCLSSPGMWTECMKRTMAEDIQIQECPHDDDLETQPREDTIGRSEDGMPAKRIVSPYGGGVQSLPSATPIPVPPADGPQLGPWQVAVVRVEETPAGDASREEPPYTSTDRRRPIDLPEVAGNDGPVLLPPPPPRAGVMKFDGPTGRSLHAEKTREPLELMVHAQTDLAGQLSATGTSSPSDCYLVGPVGLNATGGPADPDVYITDPNLLTHVIRTPPDPDGRDATTGPAGLYVGGDPVGPADCLPVLKSCKHLIPDHADPVGQHEAESDTAELLEYEVVVLQWG